LPADRPVMCVSCKAITTILAGSPWRVRLYLDDRAIREQRAALAAIVPGRAGGTTGAISQLLSAVNGSQYSTSVDIGTVHAVWRARIELSHVPCRWSIRADTYLIVHAGTPVAARALVACGIPGFRSARPGGCRQTRSASTTPRCAGTCTGGAALPPASPTAPATDARAGMKRSRCRWLGDGAVGAVARCLIGDRLPGTVPGGSFRSWACVSAVAVLKGRQ